MFAQRITKASATLLRSNRSVKSGSLFRFASTAADDEARLDAFAVLNVDRRFDVPQDDLKQSYRRLMADLHPDKHHGKPLEEQEALGQQATQVTQSYQILQQATTRASHMLQLMGRVDGSMDESSMRELLGGAQGNMLLMEVMEIREAIEEANTDDELAPFLEENKGRMDSVCDNLASAFAEQDLDSALELTVKLQYYNRIDETIREKMDERK